MSLSGPDGDLGKFYQTFMDHAIRSAVDAIDGATSDKLLNGAGASDALRQSIGSALIDMCAEFPRLVQPKLGTDRLTASTFLTFALGRPRVYA